MQLACYRDELTDPCEQPHFIDEEIEVPREKMQQFLKSG